MSFHQRLFICGIFIICSGFAFAEPQVAKLNAELQAKTQCLNPEFLVDQPNPKKDKLPLVIYLHGAGGKGQEINRLRTQMRRVTKGIEKFAKGPCIVVAPQCLRTTKAGNKGIWQATDLNLLLQQLKTSLPIDTNRIYLTGNSMGGYGTWAWGAHSPQHFAALAPVVGGIGEGGPKDVTPELEKWAASLAKVPLYAFVGAKDRVVPAEHSQRLIRAIRKAGGKSAKIKVYPEAGHNAGKLVFGSREYFDWMFAQKKTPSKPENAAEQGK